MNRGADSRTIAIAAIWPLCAVMMGAIGIVFAGDPTTLRRMQIITATWSSCLLAVPAVVTLVFHLARRVDRLPFTIAAHAAGAVGAILLQDRIVNAIGVSLELFPPPPPGQMAMRAVNLPYMAGVYVVVAITVHLFREVRVLREEEERWRATSRELASRTRSAVWQAVQPRLIRDILLSIADRCATAPREAEAQTMQLARFVRFVLRAGAAEWSPALEQVRRVKTMLRASGTEACFDACLAREHRRALVPSAITAIAAKMIGSARALRVRIEPTFAAVIAIGVEHVQLDDVQLPSGVECNIEEHGDETRITLHWSRAAVQEDAPQRTDDASPPPRRGRIRTVVALSYLAPGLLIAALDLSSSVLHRMTGGEAGGMGSRTLMIALATSLLLFVLERGSVARPRRFLLALLAGAIGAVVILQFTPFVAWLLSLRDMPFQRFNAFGTYVDLALCFVIAGGAAALRFRRVARWYRVQRHNGEDPALSHEAVALETQLQPHFFFNTLNAVAGLLAVDPHAAARVARSLAGLIESVAAEAGVYEVRLAAELQTVEQYVAIERIRFGRRLQFRSSIDAQHGEVPFPRLLLLVLVQNAVKHGVAHMRNDCDVLITAHRRLGALSVRVTNDAAPHASEERREQGRGNRQVVSRMALLYGRHGDVRFAREPRRYLAELTVPLR